MKSFILPIAFITLFNLNVSSQEQVFFIGKVTDSLNIGLEGANILLLNKEGKFPPSFGISGVDGRFRVPIRSNNTYELKISFIGYQSIEKNLQVKDKDLAMDFVMYESPNILEEVVIKYKPALQIKKDTLLYQVDSFASGKERKLAELLKKLPGIDVTKDGEVIVNNKKVTKVLVEGKTFFDGRTKMAVENIPADAINEVQIIDGFNETSFLKEFIDSEDMAMNLVLKEDKKKFVFGDIEAGLGVEEKYRFHPSLFKYGPKFISNLIADYNNTPERSFTIRDYISFEGELTPEKFREILKSPVARFISQSDFNKNDHFFAGLNNQWNPDEKNELRLFAIGLKDDYESNMFSSRIYLANQNPERRVNSANSSSRLNLLKLNYKFTPQENFKLSFLAEYSGAKNTSKETNITMSDVESDYTSSNNLRDENLEISLDVAKKFTENNSAVANLAYYWYDSNKIQQWDSNINFYPNSLNLMTANRYLLQSPEVSKRNEFKYDIKDYYKPSRTNLLTSKIKGEINNIKINTGLGQLLDSDSLFEISNFNNFFSSTYANILLGLGYKQIFGDFNLNFDLDYQYLYWIDKFDDRRQSVVNQNLLPEFSLEWQRSDNFNISFSYSKERYAPFSFQRFPGLRLQDFNIIYGGQANLQQSISETFVLKASNYRPYGLSIYTSLSYSKYRNQIINSFNFSGISGSITPINVQDDGDRYNINLRLTYGRPYWKMSVNNIWSENSFPTFYNSILATNKAKTLISDFNMKTLFEDYPNIAIGLQNNFSINESLNFSNKTNLLDAEIQFNYDIKDWKIEGSYKQTLYNNLTESNKFDYNNIGASIFYNKEDSPWEFGVNGFNLGNSKRIISNSTSSQLFQESTTLLFPRTIMLNIFYKF
ncbi:TonB-dependent receptor [Flagellimonas lutaonensis]|uniref:TonB-dependent receptor n=1 Tax=Flagellimonas lutaonensis TaxID=516051 RepID=UPI0005F82A4E|nr:TonB-dependent receptor [Allomuricauda lutaonensis]